VTSIGPEPEGGPIRPRRVTKEDVKMAQSIKREISPKGGKTGVLR